MLALSAKRRDKEFSISIKYFREWAKEVDLIGKKKSAEKQFWHIDRKKNELGYVEGNLQMLTYLENTQKAWDEDFEIHPGKATQFKAKNIEVETEKENDSEEEQEIEYTFNPDDIPF
jgi:hypothetical protein